MKKISSLFLVILVFGTNPLLADSLSDKKLSQYQRSWNRLIPRQSKLQFAGSMGMFSVGPGWFYGKKNQWETDWLIGFIPVFEGRKGHITTTIKQTYTPFRVQLNDRLLFEPLTAGIYINKIFGEYFWSRLPEKYPEKYYFWAVNTRFHVFLGQSFSLLLSERVPEKKIAFFYELNTNDLYVISAFGNKTIGFNDILGLSFGIRYRMF
jgi:hypothetical protein